MPETPTPTIQEVTAAFEKVDLKKLEATTANLTVEAVKANPGTIISQICSIYQAVKKFLQLVLLIPFIPQPWKDGISLFIKLMDQVCPA